MRVLINVIHFLLVVALLSTGLPMYQRGDANRDDRVDLADAILRVQGVARTAEQPATFMENMEEALITLSAVAGFSEVIRADRQKSNFNNPIGTLEFGPLSSGDAGMIPAASIHRADKSFLYQSIALTPSSPPPEIYIPS